MRNSIAAADALPIFERPLQIVRPIFPDSSSFLAPFQAALGSGQVTNGGHWALEFEHQLSEYLGVPTLVFCNGQMALMAMLRAAGVEGGEVIVPSFTFPATPHAVRWCGAEPVFADISPSGSLCLDPDDVERKITSRTVAILGVDAYGIACDYARLSQIGRRHGLKLVYDSAPSFGTRVNGTLVGGFGDAQMFSFHATKAFTTMEGGCLCTHDPEIFTRAKAIRNFGQTADGDCDEAGINGKLTEICALIGIEQLKSFEQAALTRRQAVMRVREGLSKLPGLTVAMPPDGQEPIWLYLPVFVDEREFGIGRDAVAAELAKENLHVRKYYSPPCHHMRAYRTSRYLSLPRTEASAYSVLALPVYNDVTADECDGIVRALVKARHADALLEPAFG